MSESEFLIEFIFNGGGQYINPIYDIERNTLPSGGYETDQSGVYSVSEILVCHTQAVVFELQLVGDEDDEL